MLIGYITRLAFIAFAATLSTAGLARSECALPHVLTNGQPADANSVMANFNELVGCIGDPISPSIDGQIVIGSSGSAPQVGTLTAGSGIVVENGPGSIKISATPGPGAPQNFGMPEFSVRDSGIFSANLYGGRAIVMPQSADVDAVEVFIITANPSAVMKPAIYGNVNGNLGALLATGPATTGATYGVNRLPLWSPLSLARYQSVYVGFVLTGSTLYVASPPPGGAPAAYFSTTGAVPNPAPTGSYAANMGWSTMWVSREP